MRHIARLADNWNSLSFKENFAYQLAETNEPVARTDDNLAEITEDPGELRRSYRMFAPSSRASGGTISYFESTNLFVDMVESLIETGMTELGLYYLALEEQIPAFETIALNTIPEIKKRHGG
jgi:hypothetical protein